MNNENIKKFADEVSQIINRPIGLDHIHPSTEGRYYYIQAPKPGAPMLLNHYRGPFFIDIHPDDYKNLVNGTVSAHEYIISANWQVGYFWGGGNMIGGGYYQPFDIVGRKDEVRRYFKILSCRGNRRASGYMPSKKKCSNCAVNNCPFSNYKTGSWSAELAEYDPRKDLFKALCKRFKQGYTLKEFLCDERVPDEEIWLRANKFYIRDDDKFSFAAYASDRVIRSLMMHEIEPENWSEFATNFKFRIIMLDETVDVSEKTLEEAFGGLD